MHFCYHIYVLIRNLFRNKNVLKYVLSRHVMRHIEDKFNRMGHTFIIPLRLVLLLFNVMLHYILIFTLIIYVLVADNTYSLPLKEQLFKRCITDYFNLNDKFDE